MKLDISQQLDNDNVYISVCNDDFHISEFYICNYEKFVNTYYNNGITDFDKLKDDIVDTILNMWALPCNKEEFKKDLKVFIHSYIIKHLDL